MATVLQTLTDMAKRRGISLFDLIGELEHEVHTAVAAQPEGPTGTTTDIHEWGNLRGAATALFGAFYDPKIHVGNAKVPESYAKREKPSGTVYIITRATESGALEYVVMGDTPSEPPSFSSGRKSATEFEFMSVAVAYNETHDIRGIVEAALPFGTEPEYMPSLRGIGGIVGLMRGFADMSTADCRRHMRRLADKLEKEYTELWHILLDR